MSMYHIASITASGSVSSITFSSIPQTFTHLQLRMYQTSSGVGLSFQKLNFNSDTSGANYFAHELFGSGTSFGAYAWLGTNYSGSVFASNGMGITPYWGVGIMDILDYRNTSKNKTFKILNGYDQNGTGMSILGSGLWVNTTAINSITITGASYNYASGSRFDLYGISTSNETGI